MPKKGLGRHVLAFSNVQEAILRMSTHSSFKYGLGGIHYRCLRNTNPRRAILILPVFLGCKLGNRKQRQDHTEAFRCRESLCQMYRLCIEDEFETRKAQYEDNSDDFESGAETSLDISATRLGSTGQERDLRLRNLVSRVSRTFS
jgi:hypothetical protein